MTSSLPSRPAPRAAERRTGKAAPPSREARAGKTLARELDEGLVAKLRPLLPIAAVVIGVAIFVYAVFFGTTEEEEVREQLAKLAAAVAVKEGESNPVMRAARLRDAFDGLLVKEVSVRIPELTGAVSGRREVVTAATQAAALWRSATIDVGGLAVAIDEAETSAHVTGDVELKAVRHAGDAERDQRSVSIRLDQIDGDWLVVSIAVSSKQDEP